MRTSGWPGRRASSASTSIGRAVGLALVEQIPDPLHRVPLRLAERFVCSCRPSIRGPHTSAERRPAHRATLLESASVFRDGGIVMTQTQTLKKLQRTHLANAQVTSQAGVSGGVRGRADAGPWPGPPRTYDSRRCYRERPGAAHRTTLRAAPLRVRRCACVHAGSGRRVRAPIRCRSIGSATSRPPASRAHRPHPSWQGPDSGIGQPS
jgi:hypothetical protein